MSRLPDWRDRLRDVITAHAKKSFKWGEQDCCVFAAECYKAQTGIDPLQQWRGQYSDIRTARRLMVPYGGLRGSLESVFGEPHKRAPEDGDVLLLDTQLGDAVGVFADGRALSTGPSGLTPIPYANIKAVWGV